MSENFRMGYRNSLGSGLIVSPEYCYTVDQVCEDVKIHPPGTLSDCLEGLSPPRPFPHVSDAVHIPVATVDVFSLACPERTTMPQRIESLYRESYGLRAEARPGMSQAALFLWDHGLGHGNYNSLYLNDVVDLLDRVDGVVRHKSGPQGRWEFPDHSAVVTNPGTVGIGVHGSRLDEASSRLNKAFAADCFPRVPDALYLIPHEFTVPENNDIYSSPNAGEKLLEGHDYPFGHVPPRTTRGTEVRPPETVGERENYEYPNMDSNRGIFLDFINKNPWNLSCSITEQQHAGTFESHWTYDHGHILKCGDVDVMVPDQVGDAPYGYLESGKPFPALFQGDRIPLVLDGGNYGRVGPGINDNFKCDHPTRALKLCFDHRMTDSSAWYTPEGQDWLNILAEASVDVRCNPDLTRARFQFGDGSAIVTDCRKWGLGIHTENLKETETRFASSSSPPSVDPFYFPITSAIYTSPELVRLNLSGLERRNDSESGFTRSMHHYTRNVEASAKERALAGNAAQPARNVRPKRKSAGFGM